jgi:1-deoxy-D-xylulose-5-phosphate reductoisomerase
MIQKKRVAILGSTGSIGTQALEVISAQPALFEVALLVAGQNIDLLTQQALAYQPKRVIIGNPDFYIQLKNALAHLPIEVQAGEQAIADAVQAPEIDMVLTALVGYAGLLPTIRAIEAGKTIALANKETLVVAGELIMPLAQKHKVDILPVDSEHSAIFQCLVGEAQNPIEKLILTASGGPFRGKRREELVHITKVQALKHPNWTMGAKITIDSATLMNKGLEVIEAKWLFGVEQAQIEVVVHPQSIIHSAVQFEDGSIKAQMGLPDMKLPIQYAMGYPQRLKNDFPRFDFWKYPQLTFEKPDVETFRNLALAYEALAKGGNAPCVLNAANEIAVERFLKDDISFLGMSDLVADCMAKVAFVASPTYNDYVESDREARHVAKYFKK